MKDNRVDKLYDYFNDNLSESEKEQVEKELDLSSESHETLDDLNVLHDSLPYSNQEIEPPTGMKTIQTKKQKKNNKKMKLIQQVQITIMKINK